MHLPFDPMTSSKFLPTALRFAPILTVLLACALSPRIACGQAAPAAPAAAGAPANADELYNVGYEAFYANRFPEALAAFERVMKEFANSQSLPPSQFYAGYTYFLMGDYDAATGLLKKVLAPPASAEIQEAAFYLLPQVTAAKAGSMPLDAAGRSAEFQNAITQYTEYLKKFPNSADAESAVYGRATCYYQLGKYKEAADDLRANVQKYPKGDSIDDTSFLLAATEVSLANGLLAETGKQDEAFGHLDAAEQLLTAVLDKKLGLAIENDCYFQLADIKLLRASHIERTKADERKKAFAEALALYRQVVSKDALVARQTKRLKDLDVQRLAAIAGKNANEVKRIQKVMERENGRLAELKKRPDQLLAAQLKVGQAYFQSGKYNATRVVMDYVAPLVETEDEKKTVLYHRAMTYALQGVVDKAMEAYDAFQAAYAADPLAESLPVAIGSMFLSNPDPSKNDPQKAIDFFSQAAEKYPKGRFGSIIAVQKATAQVALKQYDQALETFRTFLKNNPDAPKDVAVQAELGIAEICKDTGKLSEAIAAYSKVRDEYGEVVVAVEAAKFWIALCTFQLGEVEKSTGLFREFADAYPTGPYHSNALTYLGQGLLQTNKTDDGVKVLFELIEKHPESKEATLAYFWIGNAYAAKGDRDGMMGVMQKFIEAYPKDPKVFTAYDSIGQSLVATGKTQEAIDKYLSYVKEYPDSETAPAALLRASELSKSAANLLGRYQALDETRQAEWKKQIDASVANLEQLIKEYPDSPAVALALKSLLETQQLRANSGLVEQAAVASYFDQLAGRNADKPATRAKIRFALAGYLYGAEPKRALEIMQESYKPDIIFAPGDLDLLITSELKDGKLDEAQQVLEKLHSDYPAKEGIPPIQLAPAVQEAQAAYLFGLGRIAQIQGKVDVAGKYFEQLKKEYPRSPKILEASYGIAVSLRAEGKADDALPMLVQIIRSPNATPDLKANAMLQVGHIYKSKNDLEAAIDNFLKVPFMYQAVPGAAAEGLWEGGQLLEKQAATITDPAAAAAQKAKAKKAYSDLISKYPQSELVEGARKRLAALGV